MTDSSTRIIVCEWCDLEFVIERKPGRPPRYCGEDCKSSAARDYAKKLVRKQRGKIVRTPCLNCGGELDPEGDWRLSFCNDDCRTAHRSNYRQARYAADLEANRKYHRDYNRKILGVKVNTECHVCGGNIPDGRRSTLKYCSDDCKRQDYVTRAGQWAKDNPERARGRAERGSNRRRAKKASAYHEPWSRVGIADRDGWNCYICGSGIAEGELHIDHLIPISKGGEDAPRNLSATHKVCNHRKHAKITPQAVTRRGQNMMDSLREALQ